MDLESLRPVSVCLALMMDGMHSISTAESVVLRRKKNEIVNYISSVNGHCTSSSIYSGSRGEGYQFNSSDTDIMLVDKNTLVFNSDKDMDIITDDPYKTRLLMRRENCNTGFVILQLLNRTRDPAIRNSVVIYDDIKVLSSLLHRDFKCDDDSEGHGPCCSFSVRGKDYDFAFCFECKLWPTEAYGFILRPRHYQWPTKELLDKIIERGCHLVAIGDKDSDISHIQWRLSFSVAEKALMHSLNHTQYKVYGLLKMFLKKVIDTEQNVKGVICSYFLKTALFYSIESTPASFWRDDLIIHCFWLCFSQLYKWVVQGYCPNYFVPENNMFRNKIFGETKTKISLVLHKYICIGWTCICFCQKEFEKLKIVYHDQKLPFDFILINNRLKLMPVFEMTDVFVIVPDVKSAVRGFLKLLRHSRSRQEQDIVEYYLRCLFQYKGQRSLSTQYKQSDGPRNKTLYARARKSEIYLLKCSGADVSRGPLTLATSYFTTGQYKKALHICRSLISRWKSFVVYCNPKEEYVDIPIDYPYFRIVGPGWKTSDLTKTIKALPVTIGAKHLDMYPRDVKYDIEAEIAERSVAYIHPLPYLVFLSFLCHHKLGNIDSSFSTIHDLNVLVNDQVQGRHFIVYNMLAICQEKLGDTLGAVDACLQSIRLKPNRNGARLLLDKIISNHCGCVYE